MGCAWLAFSGIVLQIAGLALAVRGVSLTYRQAVPGGRLWSYGAGVRTLGSCQGPAAMSGCNGSRRSSDGRGLLQWECLRPGTSEGSG